MEPIAADSIAARPDRSGPRKPCNSPLRSNSSSFRLGTFPVRNRIGKRRGCVRTRLLSSSSLSGSVLRWCSAVRLQLRTGPRLSAADLARRVRKVAAEAVIVVAAANRVVTAAVTAVANRVVITAAIAEVLKFSSLKKARWQIHSTGPFF